MKMIPPSLLLLLLLAGTASAQAIGEVLPPWSPGTLDILGWQQEHNGLVPERFQPGRIVDDSAETYEVTAVHGPYPSR